MKRILAKNNYPTKLVDSLIQNYVEKFKNNRNNIWNRINKNELHPKIITQKDDDITTLTLKIPYTSNRLDKIIGKLRYEISKAFEKVFLNVIYTSKKLLKPLLKQNPDLMERQNVIYKFVCDCEASYIGETQKILKFRMKQHYASSASSIKEHIDTCQIYKNNQKQNKTEDRDNHFQMLFSILDNGGNRTHRRIKESAYILCNGESLNDKVKDHVYHLYGT